MSADRCPSCAAAVRPDASWCNQCYADLRPPAPAVAVQVAELPVAPAPVVPEQAVSAEAIEPRPGLVRADDAPLPSWPCPRCRTSVPFEEDVCTNCNTRFLDPDLPGVQKPLVDRLPRNQQRKASTAILVMLIGGLTLTGIFVGLFALLATIF
jgi:predicted nucleic acid-binding Zn ribbon protein